MSNQTSGELVPTFDGNQNRDPDVRRVLNEDTVPPWSTQRCIHTEAWTDVWVAMQSAAHMGHAYKLFHGSTLVETLYLGNRPCPVPIADPTQITPPEWARLRSWVVSYQAGAMRQYGMSLVQSPPVTAQQNERDMEAIRLLRSSGEYVPLEAELPPVERVGQQFLHSTVGSLLDNQRLLAMDTTWSGGYSANAYDGHLVPRLRRSYRMWRHENTVEILHLGEGECPHLPANPHQVTPAEWAAMRVWVQQQLLQQGRAAHMVTQDGGLVRMDGVVMSAAPVVELPPVRRRARQVVDYSGLTVLEAIRAGEWPDGYRASIADENIAPTLRRSFRLRHNMHTLEWLHVGPEACPYWPADVHNVTLVEWAALRAWVSPLPVAETEMPAISPSVQQHIPDGRNEVSAESLRALTAWPSLWSVVQIEWPAGSTRRVIYELRIAGELYERLELGEEGTCPMQFESVSLITPTLWVDLRLWVQLHVMTLRHAGGWISIDEVDSEPRYVPQPREYELTSGLRYMSQPADRAYYTRSETLMSGLTLQAVRQQVAAQVVEQLRPLANRPDQHTLACLHITDNELMRLTVSNRWPDGFTTVMIVTQERRIWHLKFHGRIVETIEASNASNGPPAESNVSPAGWQELREWIGRSTRLSYTVRGLSGEEQAGVVVSPDQAAYNAAPPAGQRVIRIADEG